VCDAGSKNGTLRNGAPLTPRQEASVESGDKLAFGNIETRFFLASELLTYLRELGKV